MVSSLMRRVTSAAILFIALASPDLAQAGGSITPFMFGAVGDGVTDDTAALQQTEAAASFGQTIDFGSGVYLVSAQVKSNPGVRHVGGTIKWTITTPLFGALVAADNTVYQDMQFIGSGSIGTAGASLYQVGIFSGATSTAGRSPASHVVVRGCKFSNMTVGVWVNPDSADVKPTDWTVTENEFNHIVGYPGNSEGYGAVYALASRVDTTNNKFFDVRRHAIYYTAIFGGVIGQNNINTIDNIAIQLNTYSNQPPNFGIVISNNTVNGFTRSIQYGYNSSVGIGAYGKSVGVLITGNMIFGALDVGIDVSGISGDSIMTGSRVDVSGNQVSTDPTTKQGGIQISNINDGVAIGNKVYVYGSVYGIVMSNTLSLSEPIQAMSNYVFSPNASAVGFRGMSNAPGVISASKNIAAGMPAANAWFGTTANGGTATWTP